MRFFWQSSESGLESTEIPTSCTSTDQILSVETGELELWSARSFRLLSTGPCLHGAICAVFGTQPVMGDNSSKRHGFVTINENQRKRLKLFQALLAFVPFCLPFPRVYGLFGTKPDMSFLQGYDFVLNSHRRHRK